LLFYAGSMDATSVFCLFPKDFSIQAILLHKVLRILQRWEIKNLETL